MLKLTSSFSKKVPAETQFSSLSYHASVEVELPDGLTETQLKEKISGTFALVRESVESEIGGGKSNGTAKAAAPDRQQAPQEKQAAIPASNKQVKYLFDLAREAGLKIDNLVKKFNVKTPYELTKPQCSALIDELGASKKAA
jgi:hypothetical protein